MNVKDLLELQARAYEKSPWHSLTAALDGLSEQTFTHKPKKHSGFPWMNGSIQDIVYHVTGDKLVQHSQAFETGETTWDNLSITKGNLSSMREDLKQAQNTLQNTLRSLQDFDLKRQVRTWGGKKLSVANFFLMLIEHDLYHAGQIRYIRNIVEEN